MAGCSFMKSLFLRMRLIHWLGAIALFLKFFLCKNIDLDQLLFVLPMRSDPDVKDICQ